MDDIVKKIAKKHAEKIEELTVEQFEQCLLEAIKSGDFTRHVQASHFHLNKSGALTDNSRYAMTYAPYRDKLSLEFTIDTLQAKLQTVQEKLQARQSDCMGRIDWNKGVDGMLVGELLAILKDNEHE